MSAGDVLGGLAGQIGESIYLIQLRHRGPADQLVRADVLEGLEDTPDDLGG
jgi:hypothetical protein